MAGFAVTKNDLDQRSGNAVIALRKAFEQVERINEYLGRMTTEDLVAMGYSDGDVSLLKSSFADLTVLGQVARGEVSQPAANDFFAWGGRLTGLE